MSWVIFHDTEALCFGQKDPIKVQISRFFSALMKVHPIPYVSFETTRSRFIQILHQKVQRSYLSWHWSITPWKKRPHQSTNFQIFECFNESSPNSSCQFWNHKVKVYSNFASLFIEFKFSDIWVVGWKFTKFFMSCLKLQVRFSLNFSSLFSVMRNSSLLF